MMSNDVFANGREISCKKADGKSICCFPDVCFTPPQTPATPPGVPIPYPNTAFAKDTTKGSKNVKISDQEVMLKNKSYFKKSTGNEAGNAPKKGVITGKITGKVYFTSWSPDVKVEGKNVVRNLDLTTHNHGSNTNTVTWPYQDTMVNIPGCEGQRDAIQTACCETSKSCNDFEKNSACPDTGESKEIEKDRKTRKLSKEKRKEYYEKYAEQANDTECRKKLKCVLVPKKNNGKPPTGCCPPQTPDHLIDGASFKNPKVGKYDYNSAPCICATGPNASTATHGLLSNYRRNYITKNITTNKKWKLEEAAKCGAEAVEKVFPKSGCDKDCIEAQLIEYHKRMGINKNTKIKQKYTGKIDQEEFWVKWQGFQD